MENLKVETPCVRSGLPSHMSCLCPLPSAPRPCLPFHNGAKISCILRDIHKIHLHGENCKVKANSQCKWCSHLGKMSPYSNHCCKDAKWFRMKTKHHKLSRVAAALTGYQSTLPNELFMRVIVRSNCNFDLNFLAPFCFSNTVTTHHQSVATRLFTCATNIPSGTIKDERSPQKPSFPFCGSLALMVLDFSADECKSDWFKVRAVLVSNKVAVSVNTKQSFVTTRTPKLLQHKCSIEEFRWKSY